jgi:hypothetical protein
MDDKIEMLKQEISKLKALIEINREFEDQMMNQIEKLKNDNEKLRNLLDFLLTKGLEPRRLQNLNIPKIRWDDDKNLQEQEKTDHGP